MTTAEEILEEPLAPPEPVAPAPEEEKDPSKLKQRVPPSRGLCRRCGQNKPINRLMLCYPCWVKTRLEERGWREGEPHPEWCGCGLPGSGAKSSGN